MDAALELPFFFFFVTHSVNPATFSVFVSQCALLCAERAQVDKAAT